MVILGKHLPWSMSRRKIISAPQMLVIIYYNYLWHHYYPEWPSMTILPSKSAPLFFSSLTSSRKSSKLHPPSSASPSSPLAFIDSHPTPLLLGHSGSIYHSSCVGAESLWGWAPSCASPSYLPHSLAEDGAAGEVEGLADCSWAIYLGSFSRFFPS